MEVIINYHTEILPMFAPTINSYKRYVEGYWAPTTPTWGVENRTVSFRVIPNSKGTRVEVRYLINEVSTLPTNNNRICGADMNAYLAIAASIASGYYGIKNKLPLKPQTSGLTAFCCHHIHFTTNDHLMLSLCSSTEMRFVLMFAFRKCILRR